MNITKKASVIFTASCLSLLSAFYFSEQSIAKTSGTSTYQAQQMTEETIGHKTFQVSRLVINARPEQVYKILTDYNNASHVFPRLKKCKVLEDHGTTKVIVHKIAPNGPFGTFEYVLTLKETAPYMIEWHRVSGDFHEVDGFWKLEPVDGGKATLVTYSAYISGGLFMPAAIIKRQMHTDMPEVMASLKTHAEAPTQIATSHSIALQHN